MVTSDKQVANELLAAWLQENYPTVFNELAARAGAPATAPGLSGISDIFSSIGGAITSAAKSVASGLSTTIKTVGSVLGSPEGGALLGSILAVKGAGSLTTQTIGTQYDRAQVGYSPAPIQTVYDPATGSYVPVYNNQGQQYQVDQSVLRQLAPSFMQKYGVMIAAAGGLLLLFIVLKSRR